MTQGDKKDTTTDVGSFSFFHIHFLVSNLQILTILFPFFAI